MNLRLIVESILDAHYEYAKAGFPLPDRSDLQQYPNGNWGHPTDDGHVEFHKKNINRRYNLTCLYNHSNQLHNSNGPAVIIHNDFDPNFHYDEQSYFVKGRHIKGPHPF